MSFYKTKAWLIKLLALISISACQKEVDLKIGGQQKLVINSLFNPDSLWKVHVSKSISVVSGDLAPIVTDANVQIFEEENFVEQLILGEDGYYHSQANKPLPGKSYKIKVGNEELGIAEALDTLKSEKVNILSVQYSNVRDANFEYPLNLRFIDKSNVKNYYIVKVYYVEENGNIFEADLRSDDISSATDKVSSNGICFSDLLFDGKEYNFKMNVFLPYKKIIVELRNVSLSYFMYHNSHNAQVDNPSDPFTTPVELHTNINNGLGIFAGYQSDTLMMEVESD